jgi:hypothetical protein
MSSIVAPTGAQQNRRQPEGGQQGAHAHRPVDERQERPDEYPDQQFPGAGEAVVVGGDLVGLVGDDRVDERRHGQTAEQNDKHRTQPPRTQRSPQQRSDDQDQQQEGEVELALHRHRPDVLQGGHRLAGAPVVSGRRGQLPVLVVAEAGQGLVGERLPPGLRLHQHGQHSGRCEHHDQRRQQPPRQPLDMRPRR